MHICRYVCLLNLFAEMWESWRECLKFLAANSFKQGINIKIEQQTGIFQRIVHAKEESQKGTRNFRNCCNSKIIISLKSSSKNLFRKDIIKFRIMLKCLKRANYTYSLKKVLFLCFVCFIYEHIRNTRSKNPHLSKIKKKFFNKKVFRENILVLSQKFIIEWHTLSMKYHLFVPPKNLGCKVISSISGNLKNLTFTLDCFSSVR